MQNQSDFSTAQQNHFWLVHVLPWLAIPIVIATQDMLPITLFEPVLLLVMWFITGGLGISVGFHRHFSHRAFAAKAWLRVLLAYLGQMAGQGPIIYWVALHRTHHQFSDNEGDPHSPITNQQTTRGKFAAFIFGHIGWVVSHPVPKIQRYALDLVRDTSIRHVNHKYWSSLLAGGFITRHHRRYLACQPVWRFCRRTVGRTIEIGYWQSNYLGGELYLP